MRSVTGQGWHLAIANVLACRVAQVHTFKMDDDATSFDTPNCPRCLVRLQIAGTERHPYWMCPNCLTAHLSNVTVAQRGTAS